MELKGVYTAMVTPLSKGAVDYGKLREIVEMQIAGGVDGIVPVGTTGESPTLDAEEHMKVIEETIAAAAGRCKIMAGTGANSTAEAIILTKHARSVGADCSLQVTPYYNKPTQEGIYRHFSTIADTCDIPIVLYNVPGRTGVGIAAGDCRAPCEEPECAGGERGCRFRGTRVRDSQPVRHLHHVRR